MYQPETKGPDSDDTARVARMLAVIGHTATLALLPYTDCIDLMRYALSAVSRDQVYQPLRTVVHPPMEGVMALMPAYLSAPSADDGSVAATFGVKVVSIFHDNPGRGLDTHQGVVLLLDPDTGVPLAAVDASAVTKVRTAAVSAVATDLLSLPEADDLAVIGSGTQARAHVPAIACVRRLRRVRVCSRSRSHAQRFADEVSTAVGVSVEVCAEPAAAVADAPLVVTATNATEPVLDASMVAPGAHINAIGSSEPSTRELAGDLLARATVYTDRMESLVEESGDFRMAAAEGCITASDVAGEIGHVLIGRVPARQDAHQVTVFKSLGLASEDVVAARHVYERWLAREARAASGTSTGGGLDAR